MLKKRKNVPLDYSLCNMTVTVYRREGLTRTVLDGVHYEFTSRREVENGISKVTRDFLLVIPGELPLAVGDMVMMGVGPAVKRWEDLKLSNFPTLGLVKSVQRRYWRGQLCHTEVRG